MLQRLNTITLSTDEVFFSASLTADLSSITRPRRQPPSAVMTTFASASLIRSTSDLALKPPKMTLCGAPMRAQASMAIAASGTIGM